MIQELPIEIRARERIYRQLARKGIVALYEVRTFKHLLIGFELIIIRYQKAWIGNEWSYPERERYPHNEEFGRYGWSLPRHSRETAELAFDQLSTMPFGCVKPLANKDNYIGWGKGAHRPVFSRHLASLLTGRALPKTVHRTNQTPTPTETIGNQR